MNADVSGFYRALGVELPPASGAANVAIACFVNPEAHRHEDRNKSCSVSMESGAFNCHGCGARGGAYDAAVASGRSPSDAMEMLRRHGLVTDEQWSRTSTPAARADQPKGTSTAPGKPPVTEQQLRAWQSALLQDERPLARLEELRGWSTEAIEHLGIGVDRGYRSPKGGGAVVFPARDETGALTGCVHYAPDPAKRTGSKSKSIARGPRQLFPPPESIEGDTVWLVEGEPDAVAAHSIGLPAVGVPGVEGWKDAWSNRFRRFAEVVICVDDDEHGERLASRLAASLAPAAPRVVRVRLQSATESTSNGYDLTDLTLEARANGGVAQARKLLTSAAAHENPIATPDERPTLRDADWPALAAHDRPTFPSDALPKDIAAWVAAMAEESQTPEDLAALAALGVLSAAAMGSAVVDCGAWDEELALYLLVAMPSGDRKSTVLRSAVAPLRALERARRDAVAPEVRARRSRRQVLEKTEQRLIKAVSDADALTRKEIEGELTRATSELAEIGEPVLPRLLADDATPEALGGLLAHHGSIAVIAAESALLDNLGGRYSEGAANLHLVCSAYGGESTTIDRRGRDPEEIERPLMTITLAVQPHVLDNLVSHKIARSQGLVARFAYAFPETQLGRRKTIATRMSRDAIEGWERVVERVFENPKTHDTNDKTCSQGSSVISVIGFQGSKLTLTDAAKHLLDELRAEQELRLTETGDLRPIADWAARHPGRVARLAGLLHLAQHPVDDPISETTMRQALRIGDYLLAHGLMALTGPDPLVRRALGWLARRGEATVTQRDLQRSVGQRGTAEDAENLARALERFGALRSLPSSPPASGRPPSPAFEVHPSLVDGHDRNDRTP